MSWCPCEITSPSDSFARNRQQHGRTDSSSVMVHAPDVGSCVSGRVDDLRLAETNQQRGDGKDESRQRSGDSHVEQSLPVRRERLHANEGTEGPECERNRNEIRQCHVHSVMTRREVVTEFVGSEDQHQGK